MTRRRVYAYVCEGCDHYLSGHLLHGEGDLRTGPYRCSETGCECEVAQDAPCRELSRDQYYAREGLVPPMNAAPQSKGLIT